MQLSCGIWCYGLGGTLRGVNGVIDYVLYLFVFILDLWARGLMDGGYFLL